MKWAKIRRCPHDADVGGPARRGRRRRRLLVGISRRRPVRALRSRGGFAAQPEGERFERRMCDPGLIHICLYVDDAWAEYERLSALGMEFHCEPGGAGTMLATYGRDCDGNVVELLEVIAQDHPFPYLGARQSA